MLNRRVTIKTYTTSADAYGQPVQTVIDYSDRWADVKNASGNVYNSGGNEWVYDIDVRLRYSAAKPVLVSNLLRYGGKDYKILNVGYDDQGYKFFEILKCKAVE